MPKSITTDITDAEPPDKAEPPDAREPDAEAELARQRFQAAVRSRLHRKRVRDGTMAIMPEVDRDEWLFFLMDDIGLRPEDSENADKVNEASTTAIRLLLRHWNEK